MNLNFKFIFLIALVLLTSCKGTSHKASFVFKIESTEGTTPLVMRCFDFEKLEDFIKKRNEAYMKGSTEKMEEPKPIAEFDSKTNPTNALTFVLELPEKDVTCMLPDLKFINIRQAEKSGQVFKLKGDASINVSYNMHTKSLYTVDSPDKNIEIVK